MKKAKKKIKIVLDIGKNFTPDQIKLLDDEKYVKPLNILKLTKEQAEQKVPEVQRKIVSLTRSINGTKNTKVKDEKYREKMNDLEFALNTFQNYKEALDAYATSFKFKVGEGIRSKLFFYLPPQELLKRFELISGSLAAGNNGVLPEYIQIAHRLRDLGVVTNNQLNKLLRNYLNIR